MEPRAWKVGDRVAVRWSMDPPFSKGLPGTIVKILDADNTQPVAVSLDENVGGHTCGGLTEIGRGCWVDYKNISPLVEEENRCREFNDKVSELSSHVCTCHTATERASCHAGIKFDGDKLRFELISPEFEKALAEVLTHGAKKYGDRNWELGINYSRVLGALRRHLNAFTAGERYDAETKLPHLAHAACCLMFIYTYETRRLFSFNDLPAYGPQTPNE